MNDEMNLVLEDSASLNYSRYNSGKDTGKGCRIGLSIWGVSPIEFFVSVNGNLCEVRQ